MESSGHADNGEECITIEKGEDGSNSLRWFTFQVNDVVLYLLI